MLRFLRVLHHSIVTPKSSLQRPPGGWLALALVAALPLAACQDLDSDIDRRKAARAESVAAAEQGDPQVVDLANVGYDLGKQDAPVTVIEFSDFGCQFCGSFARETFPTLKKEFIETGKVRWKFVPFVLGIFPNGDRAAMAGVCAAEQGDQSFWKMHDLLYQTQNQWKSSGGKARELFLGYASDLGLDTRAFSNCYDTNRAGPEVTRNNRLGQGLGVRATPTFFINGARVEGAIPLDLFKRVLEEAGKD